MSLLEDVFLQDEAGEAQDLERVIEGDEFEERRRSDDDDEDNNSVRGDDEAEEEKRRVDPQAPKSARVVKNPRFVLNPARLTGPRGIQVIPEHFKDFKFKGKGHEKEDLDLVLKKLEHWTYRLYPKFKFQDCLKKIEALGKKRPVMVHLHKIRSDQLQTEEAVVQQDSSGDEAPADPQPEEDEFDKLLQQQIDVSRTMTPAPAASVRNGLGTPGGTPFAMPKATSSPSISDEQKERMLRNRRLAEERRLARLRQNSTNNIDNRNENIDLTSVNNVSNNTSHVNGDITEVQDVNINDNDTRNIHVDVTEVKGVSHSESHLDVRVETRNIQVDLTEVNDNISGTEIRPVTLNGHVDLTGVTDNGNSESNLQKRPIILTANSEVNAAVDVDLTADFEIDNKAAKDSLTHEIDTLELTEVNVTGHNKAKAVAEFSDTVIENINDAVDVTENVENVMDDDDVNTCPSKEKNYKTNVIDSSDEDCDMEMVIAADIHKNGDKNGVSKETDAKMNDVDSSDDEQDLRVVNESVTVDIHNDKDPSELHNKSVGQGDKEITSGVQKHDYDKVSCDNMIVGDDDVMEVDFGDDF